MGFLAPWFLGGLAILGLPVYVHLLRQYKQKPIPFSSLMFFERRTQSSIKHRRLRYLLLFALRTLLILLIVLAFARPFIQQHVPPRTRANEITVLAIDNSMSMRAGTHLADAKTGQGGLDHHFTRELHAFSPQPKRENGAALETAQSAMKISDRRGKKPSAYEGERGIAHIAVEQRHRSAVDLAPPAECPAATSGGPCPSCAGLRLVY